MHSFIRFNYRQPHRLFYARRAARALLEAAELSSPPLAPDQIFEDEESMHGRVYKMIF
jgi:hypothetical protein